MQLITTLLSEFYLILCNVHTNFQIYSEKRTNIDREKYSFFDFKILILSS